MQQIRIALLRNDLVSASAALQAAQNLPSPSSNLDVRLPTVDAELATEIKEGRKELYQIELFDCCHEDGDIVEVLVNGKSFAAVPIMHQGTMLSIPMAWGQNIQPSTKSRGKTLLWILVVEAAKLGKLVHRRARRLMKLPR